MRILLIEDNADHRELMRLVLTGHDATWQVEGVASGEEALRHLAEGEACDLVFLDYSLPRRGGLEVLAEIRRGEAPPPVVMVTGRGDEQVAVEAMKGGAYDYVVKGEGYVQRLPVVAQRAVEAHQSAAERQRAEEALRASQRLLERTFASLCDAVFIIDTDTAEIVDCNPEASEIFGYSRQEMVGRTTTFLHVDEAACKEFRGHLYPAIEEKGFLSRLEFRMKRKDGTVFPSEHSVVPLEAERGERVGWVSVVRDITDRKRAEEALAQRTRQLEAVRVVANEITRELELPTLLELIIRRAVELLGGNTGTVRLWDEEAQLLVPVAWHGLGAWAKEQNRRLGEKISGTIAQRREGLIVNDYPGSPYANPTILEHAPMNAVCGEPLLYRDRLLGTLTVDKHVPESSFTEEDQEILRLFTTQAAIAIENARLFERIRRGRERLWSLSRRLVEVQETERRTVARELHDEIGQLLTGLKLLLEMPKRFSREEILGKLEAARSLLTDLTGRVREMSLALRPAMLDDLGLLPALLWHFERYTDVSKVRVRFEQSGLEGRRFAPDLETAVYRIVQEALTNVTRHARTPEVTVRVQVGPETLTVQVEDGGIGFDAQAVLATSTSSGLTGMRERAQLLGGHLSVESAPGTGTMVKAELPLGDTGAVERRREGRGA